ncbi:MAG: sigma-54 dependent transcriptional regulator [Treponema sp.]|jgi:Nif-specific regulatory protein|nr:sigma-54 dependent transcriptional regulator [Treponema sp.]
MILVTRLVICLNQKVHTKLIAHSPRSLETVALAERIALSDSSVLIVGESGVGKEVFAQYIHAKSKRKSAPFIAVNCAALPELTIEDELFGHVRGAFTGAYSARRGHFEMADKGTLFLDELGDLELSLQAKLLRVVQCKRFERLGSGISHTVDVRLISATNKNLPVMVENGSFRSDLYHRINVLLLVVPPLRERKEDIIPLAHFFLERLCTRYTRNIKGFSAAAKQTLELYLWPGNIRELEHCIERAVILGKNNYIRPDDLFLKDDQESTQYSLREAVKQFKLHYIRQVLVRCGGNKTKAAHILQIQRTYLSKISKHYKEL